MTPRIFRVQTYTIHIIHLQTELSRQDREIQQLQEGKPINDAYLCVTLYGQNFLVIKEGRKYSYSIL